MERNKRRNGPIFGLEERLGTKYPNVVYDLYSKEYWKKNHNELVKNAFIKFVKLLNLDIKPENC